MIAANVRRLFVLQGLPPIPTHQDRDEAAATAFLALYPRYLAGELPSRLAPELGCDLRTFHLVRKRLALPTATRRGRGPVPIDPAQLHLVHARCLAGGLSQVAACRELDCSRPTLHKLVAAAGLPSLVRPGGWHGPRPHPRRADIVSPL
jgi:hypothetical protein